MCREWKGGSLGIVISSPAGSEKSVPFVAPAAVADQRAFKSWEQTGFGRRTSIGVASWHTHTPVGRSLVFSYIVGRTELASEEKWIPNYGHQPAVGWGKSIKNISCNIYLIRFRDCVRSRSPFFPRDWCTQVRDPIFHRIHRDGANWVWAVMVEVFCLFLFLLKI